MATTLIVRDRSVDGADLGELTLEFLTDRITVRELIRSRVYQEVTEYNARRVMRWTGLFQPETDPASLGSNGAPRRVNWEAQCDRALRAFNTGTLLIVVEGRQLDKLDDEIELRADASVAFLRLVPLIGG
jgi:hypothetical protein